MENIIDTDINEEAEEEAVKTEDVPEESGETEETEEIPEESEEPEDDFGPPPEGVIEPPPEEVIEEPAEEAKETPAKKPFPIKKIFKISGIVLASLAAIYIAGVIFYSSHFFFGTKIGSFDCSNLSISGAAEHIKTDINGYTLNLVCRGEASEHISGKDISLVYEAMGSLADIKKKQNPLLWATDYKCRNLNVDIDVSYDETALLDKLKSLECVAKSNAAMEGATEKVYYDGVDMTYKVKDGNSPDIVSVNRLLEKSKIYVAGLYKSMDLDAEGCYVGIAGEDRMHGALDTLNKYVSTKITYLRGDDSTKLDGSTISDWLSLKDDYTVTIDSDALGKWVDDLAAVYNTVGKDRQFTTNSGSVITVKGGDYGWKVDTKVEAQTLTENINAGGEHEREPAYSRTALKHGANDLSNTYVEVSIDRQHVWYYKDGNVVVSTDCVTGDPTKNLSTHTGTYYVKYKERNATLKGEDYETPVDFWMPFNGGEGLHDLSSRGAFGGGIYKGNGSHGCVNLPHSAAKTLYENIERGTPVVVY